MFICPRQVIRQIRANLRIAHEHYLLKAQYLQESPVAQATELPQMSVGNTKSFGGLPADYSNLPSRVS